ncbi:hypothetical protein LINPERHAP1_LOCUS18176, partial [Linum perenne]
AARPPRRHYHRRFRCRRAASSPPPPRSRERVGRRVRGGGYIFRLGFRLAKRMEKKKKERDMEEVERKEKGGRRRGSRLLEEREIRGLNLAHFSLYMASIRVS